MFPNDTDLDLPAVSYKPDNHHSSTCDVSIIMHCRGRPHCFSESLQSLVSTCSNIADVEILVKLDDDDPTISEYGEILRSFPFQHKLLIYSRLEAWWSVHIFENDLARLANGKTLWIFNEDNAIVKGEWLRSFKRCRNVFPDNIYVCHVPGVNPGIRSIVAPAFSREWFNVMQIVSPHTFSDRFLCYVARDIGRLLSTKSMSRIQFTHKKREKVARPAVDLEKSKLTQILNQQIKQYTPLFQSAIDKFNIKEI